MGVGQKIFCQLILGNWESEAICHTGSNTTCSPANMVDKIFWILDEVNAKLKSFKVLNILVLNWGFISDNILDMERIFELC